tara:strand:+ start:475 stop:579 length:105 start_codon:yes stop_codon:yes gene_type:complete
VGALVGVTVVGVDHKHAAQRRAWVRVRVRVRVKA